MHFVFGAIVGGFLGFVLCFRAQPNNDHGWIFVPALALVLGTVGGIYGDRCWYGLGRWFRYWWP